MMIVTICSLPEDTRAMTVQLGSRQEGYDNSAGTVYDVKGLLCALQLLMSRWDPKMSRDVLAHWLDLMNKQGWIAREQVGLDM